MTDLEVTKDVETGGGPRPFVEGTALPADRCNASAIT